MLGGCQWREQFLLCRVSTEFSFLRGLFSSAYKLPLLLPTSRTKRKIKRKLSWPSFPFQLLAMSLSHLQHTIQKVAYSRIGLHFLSSFCLLNIHRADFLHQIARAPGLTHTPCLLTAPLRCPRSTLPIWLSFFCFSIFLCLLKSVSLSYFTVKASVYIFTGPGFDSLWKYLSCHIEVACL